MADVFICVDALKPSDTAIEQAYSLGSGPVYTGAPVLIDTGDGEQASLLPSSNTYATWFSGRNAYKLVNRQQVPYASVILKSTDKGSTWAPLDLGNSPAFQHCSGYFDGLRTVFCAFVTANSGAGVIELRNFDLVSETWGAVYGIAGAPVAGGTVAVWKRPNSTLLILYNGRTVGNPTASGMGGASYDLLAGSWGAPFDVGGNVLLLTGWDAAQTVCSPQFATSVKDSTGVVHVFFNSSSNQTVPVVWGNRCFHQAVNVDDSLGPFTDFPGQVAPFPAFPYNSQQLNAYEGSPLGTPVIVGDMLVLPVLMRNDSIIDRFPVQLANVYIGSPVANPVWSLNSAATIDPGALLDDFIFPQQSPMAACDGTTLYCVFPCQDEDGQNFARLRLCQTTNLANPADPASWSASTIFDLQVNAPAGFQFPTQELVNPSIAIPGSGLPNVIIQLIGWKLYPKSSCPDPVETPAVSSNWADMWSKP